MPQPSEAEPLVGRRKELARLAAAVKERRPLLIHGPADAGKTFLVRRLLDSLPAAVRQSCLYVSGFASIHEMLEEIAGQLFAKLSPVSRRAARPGVPAALPARTSGRLRLLLRDAVRERRLCLFLDHAPRFSPALARLAGEWMWRGETAVYLLARGKTRDEIGYAWSLYYTPELRLEVGRLPEHAAKLILERCIGRFALAPFDSEEFRAGVLRLSRALPGAIVKMCALASEPRYHYGRQVKLRLLHVDYLLQGAGRPATQRGAA